MFDWLKRKSITSSGELKDALFLAAAGSTAGVAVNETTALQMATVFACARVRSESFAQLPVSVCEVQEDGTNAILRDHHLAELFRNRPSGHQTPFEFLEKICLDLDMGGNYYAVMQRRRGEVTSFLPLPAKDVTAEWDATAQRIVYTVPGLSVPGGDVLTSDQILHIKLMSRDGVTGLSPIRQAREAIGLGLAAERHGANTFRQGARPSGAVKIPHALEDSDYERLARQWNENYSGENSGKTAILEMGAEFTPISMTNEDVQFLATRKYQRSEIAGIYRVPPHMIGDLDNATFSNIEHQSLEFNMHAMAPLAKRVESAINRYVVPEKDRGRVYIKFNLDALVRGDLATRMAAYSTAIQNGIHSPNEVRAREDYPPYDGGEVYLQPLNMAGAGGDQNEEM